MAPLLLVLLQVLLATAIKPSNVGIIDHHPSRLLSVAHFSICGLRMHAAVFELM
jgi:hypothetical protein